MANDKSIFSNPAITLAVSIIGALLSGIVALTYSDMRDQLKSLKADVLFLQTDPSPRPQAVIALRNIEVELSKLDARINRNEDRINNLHSYIIQAVPPPRVPFQRRGGDLVLPITPPL